MLSQLLEAPVWSRLFLGFILLVLTLQVSRQLRYPGVRVLVFVPLVLLLRDLASVYYLRDFLFVATDLLVIGVYLIWVTRYVRVRYLLPGYFGSALILLAFDQLTMILDWPGYASIIVEAATVVAAMTTLTVVLIDVRELYVADAAPVVRARYPLVLLLGAGLFLGIVQDYGHPLVLSVLLPATYFGHFFVVRAYQVQREVDLDTKVRLRERYLDTLFDFMTRTRVAMEEHAPTESVLSYVVSTVAEAVEAESAVALLIGADGRLHVQASYGFFPPPYEVPEATKTKIGGVEKYFRARPLEPGETVLGQVAQTGRPRFVQDCSEDQELQAVVKDRVGYMSSLIVTPLISGEKPIGVVAVAHREEGRIFSRDDFSHAAVLAEYASLTLDNLFNYMEILEKKQMEKEISMAADIQRGMLPEGVPRLRSIGLGAFTSAARGMSGDYYDFFTMRRSGRIALTVCDVAGKGIPASLVMVMIRTIMRLLSSTSMDAATMTSWVNRGVVGSVDLGRFATFSIVAYDPRSRTLEYSNAGHLPIMLYRQARKGVEALHTQGLPIGIERSARYQTRRYQLEEGDMLIMYTDGIVEAKNESRDEFGWERLEDVVVSTRDGEAQDVVNAIADQVQRFTDGQTQSDDQTILVMKVGA